MNIMYYPSIREEDLLDYSNKTTWRILHSYINAHIQRLLYEYPDNVVHYITILKSQCANMTFSDKTKYSRLSEQVVQKGGESEINYINIF